MTELPRPSYVLWACPTPGCGNYYGSSSALDLREQTNRASETREWEPRPAETFARSQCPDCRARGLEVDREPLAVVPA